jgi:NAD-dependent dihydropyrimidine dehydrogenase PreA subunit
MTLQDGCGFFYPIDAHGIIQGEAGLAPLFGIGELQIGPRLHPFSDIIQILVRGKIFKAAVRLHQPELAVIDFAGIRAYACGTGTIACPGSLPSTARGIIPRPHKKERVRQRFMHKFKYIPLKREGEIGCGRCVTLCPVNIDVRDVVRDMSA